MIQDASVSEKAQSNRYVLRIYCSSVDAEEMDAFGPDLRAARRECVKAGCCL